LKKRASSKQRKKRRGLVPGRAEGPAAAIPFIQHLSGARGVRAPLETFLASMAETVPYERASFFMLTPGGGLEWCGNFWRTPAGDEPVVGLSSKFVDWAMADSRPKVAPPGAMGDRRAYLFVPLWGLEHPLGLAILRTLLEVEALGVATMSSVQGMAGWFGERIAYAVAYLSAEADRMRLSRRAMLTAQLLESVAEGLLALDGRGRVLFMNRNARLLLGLLESSAGGARLEDLVPPELSPVLNEAFAEAAAKGHALARRVNYGSGAAALPLELGAIAVPGARELGSPGESPPVLLIVRNLAAGRRLERLEEIDRLKSEFISTVSHELKNPLHTVREAAKLLSEDPGGELTGEGRKLVDIIDRNVDWLMRLIEDLLDMGRLESGRIELDRTAVDLDALAASVAGRFRVEAARRDLELRVEAGAGGERVDADPDRIEQVLVNLLSNAFKFTLEGFVEVRTSADEEGVKLSVADSGVGIAAEDLPLIFDEFEQVGKHREGGRKGTGLGLAISKRLVDLHGGELTVSSSPGQGSTFTVCLPRSPAEEG
jgi:signal transduction histidine kinase